MQFFSLGVQREIARNTVIEAGYVGSKSTRLAKGVNFNVAPPGSGAIQTRRVTRQDLGNIFVTQSTGNATYHSLHLQLERRMSGGLLVLAGYTYGKVLTDVPNSTGDKGGTSAQNFLTVCTPARRAIQPTTCASVSLQTSFTSFRSAKAGGLCVPVV